MRTLDSTTAAALQQVLEARRAHLIRAVSDGVGVAATPPDGSTADATDVAAGLLQAQIRDALADRQYRQLVEVEAAIERLHRGRYGFCRQCGAFIGLQRLTVLPFAWRCTRCQRAAEGETMPAGRARPRAPGAPGRAGRRATPETLTRP